MASIPPKKILSMSLHPNAWATQRPNTIIEKMMVDTAMMGDIPILMIFLNEKSSPNENKRNMTPMSAQIWMLSLSITDMVYGMWGDTTNPATI